MLISLLISTFNNFSKIKLSVGFSYQLYVIQFQVINPEKIVLAKYLKNIFLNI